MIERTGGPGSHDEFTALLATEREQRRWQHLVAMTPEERRAWSERHWRDARQESERRRQQRACPVCGNQLLAAGRKVGYYGNDHSSATYCSNACKQKAYRNRKNSVTGETAVLTRNATTEEVDATRDDPTNTDASELTHPTSGSSP